MLYIIDMLKGAIVCNNFIAELCHRIVVDIFVVGCQKNFVIIWIRQFAGQILSYKSPKSLCIGYRLKIGIVVKCLYFVLYEANSYLSAYKFGRVFGLGQLYKFVVFFLQFRRQFKQTIVNDQKIGGWVGLPKIPETFDTLSLDQK
jgi:hypothetical protein